MNIRIIFSWRIFIALATTLFLLPAFSFAATIRSAEAGGSWNSPETWVGGVVPGVDDDVIVTPTVKFPNQDNQMLQVRSVVLTGGKFVFNNNKIVATTVEIDASAKITSYIKKNYIGELTIDAENVIHKGEITYPANITITGDFTNEGQIKTVLERESYLKVPTVTVIGDIRNDSLTSPDFYFLIPANSPSKPQRIYGTEKANIKFLEGEHYFRGDIDADKISFLSWQKLYLDDGRVFSFQESKYQTSQIGFPNRNSIIFGKGNWTRINAPESTLYFQTDNSALNSSGWEIKKIFFNANTSLKWGTIEAERIIIPKEVILNLSKQNYSGSMLTIYADIENHGTVNFLSNAAVYGDIHNYGDMVQGLYSTSVGFLGAYGDVYNHKEAIIVRRFTLMPTSVERKIVNEGQIDGILITEDTEFSPDTTFNFSITSNAKNVIVSGDLVYDVPKLQNTGFISKNGDLINMFMLQNMAVRKDFGDFNLVYSTPGDYRLTLYKDFPFNDIYIGTGVHLDIQGDLGSRTDTGSYLYGNVVNHGEIGIRTKYTRQDLDSNFFSSISNKGIITGKTAFALPDGESFKYIISENFELRDADKAELGAAAIVAETIDVVPYLSEANKTYYIHFKRADAEEVTVQEVVSGAAGPVPITPDTPADFPAVVTHPNPPAPGDRTAPRISLIGENPIRLYPDEQYEEWGATAHDDLDGDLTSEIVRSGSVESGVLGSYLVNYSVSDFSGNRASMERVVVIGARDEVSPVIGLVGEADILLMVGDAYEEQGAEATDDVDGDISENVVTAGEVNTEVTGIYTIVYSVSDAAGNTAQVERVVRVSGGDAEITLPIEIPEDDTEDVQAGGSSGRSSSGSSKTYSCKDSTASNFSNTGTHDQDLCEYEQEQADPDLEPQQVDDVEQNEEENEEEKSETEEQIFLLTSACLDINSVNITLKRGQASNEKSEVVKIQVFLQKYGYPMTYIDGVFGRETKSSLAQFQTENGLYPDGVFGHTAARFIDRNCGVINSAEEDKQEEEDAPEEQEVEEVPTESESIEEEQQGPQNQSASIAEAFDEEKWNSQQESELARTYEQETGKKINRKDLWSWINPFSKKGFSLENEIPVTGGKVWSDRTVRKISFEVVSGSHDSDIKSNGNEVYILVHGWKTDISKSNSWVKRMKNAILAQGNAPQIVYLNWHDIMKDEPLVDLLNPKDKATWIRYVAEAAVLKLDEWGLDKNNTTIIGHSMGAILSGVLSKELGGVETLIALDPAYSAGARYLNGEYQISSSKGDKFTSYEGKSQLSRCFVGLGSTSGSEKLVETCDESVGVNFRNLPFEDDLDEHHWVVDKYIDITHDNPLYAMMLTNIDQAKNRFDDDYIELKIKGADAGVVDYMDANSGKKSIRYGSGGSNKLSCKDDVCEFAGGGGGDRIYQNKKDVLVKDFRKEQDEDKLYLDEFDGYTIYSDEDNETTYLTLEYKSWVIFEKEVVVVLEGKIGEDVHDWIMKAKSNLRKDKDQQETPVIIK